MHFDDYEDEMNLRGYGLTWQDMDAMCKAGVTQYCRPGQAPAPAPIKMTMDIVTPGDKVFPIPPSVVSPVAQMPSGFYERNQPTVSPSPTVTVQPEMIMPMPQPIPQAYDLEPESLVQRVQSAESPMPGMGLLVTAALALLMR